MPLIYSRSLENKAGIAIWHASEYTAELESSLDRLPDFSPVKSERRRRELICARILLKNLLGNGLEINYEETGKPVLRGAAEKISVAHTADFVAVLIHPYCEAGIDIEVMNDRIKKIAPKYVSEEEYKTIVTTNKENLYKIWGAKEVAYKIFGKKGVDFKKDFLCYPFSDDKIKIKHDAPGINKVYELDFENLQEHNLMVVYGFDNI